MADGLKGGREKERAGKGREEQGRGRDGRKRGTHTMSESMVTRISPSGYQAFVQGRMGSKPVPAIVTFLPLETEGKEPRQEVLFSQVVVVRLGRVY